MSGGYDDRVSHNYSGENPKTLCNNISQDFLSGSLFYSSHKSHEGGIFIPILQMPAKLGRTQRG